jgi:hypothetical protein
MSMKAMMERKMKNRIGAGLNPGPGQFVPESSRPIAPMPQTDVKGKIARQMVCSHFTINALQLIVNRIEEIIKKCQKCQNPCNSGRNPIFQRRPVPPISNPIKGK